MAEPEFGKARRHRWNVVDVTRVPACESPDGNDRTEKSCAYCSLIKITVHPPQGYPYRKWRRPGEAEWQVDATPPCGPTLTDLGFGQAAEVPFK